MSKRFLKIVSGFLLFFFGASVVFSPVSFAREPIPCWNDGALNPGKGGAPIPPTGGQEGEEASKNSEEVAEPVKLATGNFSYQTQDLFIPSRGFPLDITRTYNSLDSYEGPFGIGWSHTYNIFLIKVADGTETYIVRRNADSSKDKFLENTDGTYTAASPGCYDTLTKTASDYQIRDKHGATHIFDLSGKLIAISDRNGNTMSFEYNTSGTLYRITDTVGRTIEFNYNTDNKVISIADFAERTITYAYDTQTGDLITATTPPTDDYPSGLTTTYGYDDKHRLTSITDPKGNTYLTNLYDEYNRVYEQVYGGDEFFFTYESGRTIFKDRRGFVTHYYLNPDGTTEREVRYTAELRPADPESYTTYYEYNGHKESTRITYPEGNIVQYQYDTKGNIAEIRKKPKPGSSMPDIVTTFTYDPDYSFVKTITDPRQNVTTYDYDNKGNLEKITYPTVGDVTPKTSFTYNDYGQLETAKYPNNYLTKYEYYPDTGYLKKIYRGYYSSDQQETGFTYDAVGNVESIKDPRENTTTFIHNELNQLVMSVSPAPFNYVTKYHYDENGNLKKVERQKDTSATLWQTTEYTYTVLDQLETIKDDLGNIIAFGYDANGNRASVVDQEDNLTRYEYDERDYLWKVIDALDNTTEYAYHENGNLKEIKDTRQNKTAYTYDDFDRLQIVTCEDGTKEQYYYDKNSNLETKINRKDEIINYDYDELNRLKLKDYPDLPDVQYKYDTGSRLTDAIDASLGTLRYDYDTLNRVKKITYPNGKAVSYEYDKAGNRKKLTYPDSSYITYEYDELNRLTDIKDQSSQTIAHYDYDVLSKREKLTFLNGTQTTYTYDDINRLEKLVNTLTGQDLTYAYTYDKVGNRKTMTVNTIDTHAYIYDDIYQLTDVDYPTGFASPDTTYNYDEVGNRLSTVDDGTTTYDPNNMNQYASVDGTPYTYDDNGNLLTDGANTYTYDSENRLVSATTPEHNITYTNCPFISYQKRIAKNVDGVVTKYLYDGEQVIAEYDGTGTLLRKYIYGPGIDEPIQGLSPQGTVPEWYYHYDGLGSVVALSDTSGNLTESYSYDIFGEVTSSFSQVGNPYYFTARRYDEETGLYYYRARYYSPTLGRFLQVDPLRIDDENTYSYCYNDPVNWVDPYGLYIAYGAGVTAETYPGVQKETIPRELPIDIPTESIPPGLPKPDTPKPGENSAPNPKEISVGTAEKRGEKEQSLARKQQEKDKQKGKKDKQGKKGDSWWDRFKKKFKKWFRKDPSHHGWSKHWHIFGKRIGGERLEGWGRWKK